MSLSSHWKDPEAWQSLTIVYKGTYIAVPGVVTIECPGRERKIAVNQSPQASGAYYVNQGVAPSPITVDIVLWEEQQYADYMALIIPVVEPALLKNTGLSQFAVEVINSQLNQVGINKMLILRSQPPKPNGPGGAMRAVWQCVEYAPAKPMTPYPIKTPQTSTGGQTGGIAVVPPSQTTIPKGA